MYIASISNPLQYSESRQPLDAVTSYLTDKILADIDKLQGNEGSSKPQLYTATPGFQNRTKADLIAGKQNLGAMALGNSHHMLAQAVHLVTQGHKNIDHFNLNQLGNIYSQDPNFHDKQTIVTLISDWISAMINAHVDVAKDPYINRLNVRKFTLNMTNYLLRAGKGESTFYFLSQKILRDIASEFEALSGYYGVDDNLGDAASAAKSKVKQTYLDKLNSFGWTLDKVNAELERMTKPGGINPFDIKTLREFMPEDNSAKWYLNQLAILKVFEDIEPSAKALSENTKLSQIDTKKYGNNFALQQNFLIKMAEFAQNDKVFADPLSVIRNTFLKDKLYYALIRPRQYVGNVLLRTTPEFENKRRKIYQITGRHHASSDKYVNDITRMMEACYKTTFWKEYAAKNGVKVGSLLAGSNSVPRRLYTIKQLIKSNPALGLLNSDGSFSNTLLDSISMMIKTDKQDMVLPDFIQFKHNRSDDHNLDDHLIRAWEELLELTTTDATLQPQVDIIRNFARDLVIYSFFTSGDAFGRNNIFKYVPESFRESCGYYDYIRKLESEPSTILDKIDEEDVIKNLWWNDEVVPSHNEIIKEYYDDEFVKHYELNNWYIPSNKTVRKGVEDVPVPLLMSVPKAKVIGLNTLEQPLYQPYIKVDFGGRNNPLTTHMYRFVGTREFEVIGRNGMPVLDSEGKPVTRQQPIYTLINKKGLKHKGRVIVETSGIPRSLLGINNNNELPKDFFINNAIKFNLDSNKSMNLKAEEGYVGEIEWLKDKLFGTINEQSEYKVLDKRSDESVSLALDWSVKEGWSVDYFYNEVEPRLQEAWQMEFEYLHDQNQEAQFRGEMTYSYRDNKRPEIKSNTTFEAIQRGERTATTRYESDGNIDYWKQANVGDIIAWDDDKGNVVKVKVTKPLTKLISQRESNNTADYTMHSGGAFGIKDAKLAQEFEQFVAETSTWYDEQDVKSVQKELSELPEVKTTPSFTFADGTKIDTPFELNEQQKFALLELEKFYNGNETFFSLQGYAGTGKTTIMKIFDAYMRKKYDQPLYLAPTHKANAVTKANNPDVNASTVHSALGIVPSYDMTSDSFDVSKITFDDPSEAKIEKQQVVILDECSMLPDALVDYICDAVREKDSKLIFLGDPAQLSPVKQSTLSKSFNMNSKVELTKVERTGDNSILKEATNLRESKPLSYQTDLNSKGQGIMFTNNNNTIAILLQSVLKSDEFKANPLHFKILSGTNDLIPIYNNIVRTILYGKDAPTLVKGELLMSYANAQYNNKNKKRPYNIINSGDYMVDKIDEVTNKSIPHMPGFEITGRNVELIELPSGHRIKTFLVDKSVPNKTLRAITLRVRELWAENKRLRAEKQFTAAGIIFDQIRDIEQSFTTMSNIIDEETGAVIKSKTFDYGYTQSVHKSQGSTYDKVMVIGGSFDKFPSESIRQQLKYVAVTRAREQVIYTVPTNVQVNPQGLSQITKAKWAEIQERLKQCKG